MQVTAIGILIYAGGLSLIVMINGLCKDEGIKGYCHVSQSQFISCDFPSQFSPLKGCLTQRWKIKYGQSLDHNGILELA